MIELVISADSAVTVDTCSRDLDYEFAPPPAHGQAECRCVSQSSVKSWKLQKMEHFCRLAIMSFCLAVSSSVALVLSARVPERQTCVLRGGSDVEWSEAPVCIGMFAQSQFHVQYQPFMEENHH